MHLSDGLTLKKKIVGCSKLNSKFDLKCFFTGLLTYTE